MLISAIFIIAMLILYIIFNFRSKFSYVLGIFFFSISMLLIVSALYISKTGNYYGSIQTDYDIFLLLSQVRIPFMTISRFYNISIVLYFFAQILLCKLLKKYRWTVMFVLSLPMLYFIFVNDPSVTWKLFSMYHSSEPKVQESFQVGLNIMRTINNGIIIFYTFFPIVVLGNYYRTAQFRFKRRYALVFIACISLIDMYVNVIILNGYFRSINYNNIDLTKFPASQASQQAYILAPILALVVTFTIIVLTFYYKPFYNFLKVREKELIRSTRILNQNITTVLHTYKNAFIGVNRLSQAALKNLETMNTENASECLKVMKNLSDDQLSIINKTLWLLRSINMGYYIVNINDCINAAIEQSAVPEHITLEHQKNEELFLVSGDKQHLTEAIVNIIHNSVNALTDVNTPVIRINSSKDRDGDFMVVEIYDNGKGIPKKDLKNVFEPFYSNNPRINGGGVGLTYVKNVIRLHRGDIEAESEAGKYTIFKLILPLLHKKPALRRTRLWKEK